MCFCGSPARASRRFLAALGPSWASSRNGHRQTPRNRLRQQARGATAARVQFASFRTMPARLIGIDVGAVMSPRPSMLISAMTIFNYRAPQTPPPLAGIVEGYLS